MAGDKPWQRGSGGRRRDTQPRRRVLMVCEDEKRSRHWAELEEPRPERNNPSTRVHKLVEFLNELADLGPT